MEEPALSRWMAEITCALDELCRRHPEAAPAFLDGRRAMVHLASGEQIALRPLLADLVDCAPELAAGVILDHLLAARAAAADLSRLPVGSWSAMSPRLGLVLRRHRTGLLGPPIGPGFILAAMIDAGQSLIPVTDDLVRRWDRSAAAVIEVATANTTGHPIEFRQLDLPTWMRCSEREIVPSAPWVALGGPFTTGHLADFESIMSRFDGPEMLATCLGDHALLLTSAAHRMTSESRFELAQALQNLAADLRRTMSIRPGHDSDAILRCRSDGQVTIFRIRGYAE